MKLYSIISITFEFIIILTSGGRQKKENGFGGLVLGCIYAGLQVKFQVELFVTLHMNTNLELVHIQARQCR